jgi:enoyl-CoA hydratase
MGLVNRTYSDHAALLEGVFGLAREIAAKSPVAVRGTKEMLRYMRDHRIDDGLEYIATWNASMLQSEDLRIAIAAHMSKQKPEFSN